MATFATVEDVLALIEQVGAMTPTDQALAGALERAEVDVLDLLGVIGRNGPTITDDNLTEYQAGRLRAAIALQTLWRLGGAEADELQADNVIAADIGTTSFRFAPTAYVSPDARRALGGLRLLASSPTVTTPDEAA